MHTISKEMLKNCIGLNTETPWERVYLEVHISSSGNARIYIKGMGTCFIASGYCYCKASAVLAQFINYYTGTSVVSSDGNGISYVEKQAKILGVKLSYYCETKDGFIYLVEKE